MKAYVVIGANYGDEGKGLTVDYLARQQAAKGQAPLVVRFNGGAQAGHTVVDGVRSHIFHHIGAGSFVPKARTYLSSQFIVNPYVLQKELQDIETKKLFEPLIYVHPQCPVTTIFDMALNSIAELARGDQRHGSCGVGINETVTRTLAGFQLRVGQAAKLSVSDLEKVMTDILERWVPQRLEALGIDQAEFEKHTLYLPIFDKAPELLRLHAEYLKEALRPLIVLDKSSLDSLIASVEHDQHIIFEGAQGLALDEVLGAFPHVTRSICGLPSAMAVGAFELNVTEFEPIYVTRAYLTRHGAGPLALENEPITDRQLKDLTNVTNPWQGSLRLAPLNIPQLKSLIDADIARVQQAPAVALKGATLKKAQLMLTCLDQLSEEVCVVNTAGALVKVPSVDLPLMLARELGRDVAVTLCSYGPTAAHVKTWI